LPDNLSETGKLLLENRYLQTDKNGKKETPEDFFHRVAAAVAGVERDFAGGESARWEERFYELMSSLDFLPNTPTLINAGKEKGQLAACFVLPVEDSLDSIFTTLKNAALLHKSGGGTGFSFSNIRPRGTVIDATGGITSGPLAIISVYNEATEAIKQGGVRRGANMGVLRIDHPDIMDFIKAKSVPGRLANFNLSVAITDEFITKLKYDEQVELKFHGKSFRTVPAKDLFNTLVYHTWLNGEPGILFADRINRYNPTPELGTIEATNPCGEQPLLNYESCVLGSVNLANMTENRAVNWPKLAQTVFAAVRFLDNVLDSNYYPLPQILSITKKTRKIGLGVMGWADLLFQLEIPYDSQKALKLAVKIMKFIQEKAHQASAVLAAERGPFPAFAHSNLKTPRRNATCTTIAPTGSISLLANCSSGIEPVFLLIYKKKIMENKTAYLANPYFEKYLEQKNVKNVREILKRCRERGTIKFDMSLPEEMRRIFVTALDIAPGWHVKMQAAFQRYCDNAVSKTVNLPFDTTVAEVGSLILSAHKLGCKGITAYRFGSRPDQVQFI